MAFRKIKWRFCGPTRGHASSEIPYKLTDSNTFVYHDNKQIHDPGRQVVYCKMEEKHDTCGGFYLTPTSHLRCVLQPVDFAANRGKQEVDGDGEARSITKANQNNVGALFRDAYMTRVDSSVVQIMWATRWTMSGLMPLRSLLMCAQRIQVPAKKANNITGGVA